MKSVFGPKVLLLAAFTCLLLVAALPGAALAVNETIRVSVSSSGEETNGPNHDYHLDHPAAPFSADNRYVVFQSAASNLVQGDTNGCADIFLHDMQTRITTRISLNSSGEQGNDDSITPSISANGRYVAFASSATNLVDGDINSNQDIFLRDLQTGTTTLISPDLPGWDYYIYKDSSNPSISADGRYIAYSASLYNNLGTVTGYWVYFPQVFVYDTQTATTTWVSVSSSGTHGNDASSEASISADGRYVAFESAATNLVVGDDNNFHDIFVHDMQTGTTTIISVTSDGIQGNNGSFNPSISADGRYVAFESGASNLRDGDNNGYYDIFVHDRQTGAIECVSRDSLGKFSGWGAASPSVSADGRFIAFRSYGNIASPRYTIEGIYVHDRLIGITTLATVPVEGIPFTEEYTWSPDPAISADGAYVSFASSKYYLVPDDTNANDDLVWMDIFVRDWQMGALKVTISPQAALDAGAGQWTLHNNSGFHVCCNENGSILTGLPLGQYFIDFPNISSWNTPSIVVNVLSRQQITYSNPFYFQTGPLRVTITPQAAINAGALWSVDGVTWNSSNVTVQNLRIGQHTVTFKPIVGWDAPTDQTVTVTLTSTAYAYGTYIERPGSLKVTLSPQAAINAGAMWRIDGGDWKASGVTMSGLSTGKHTVSFSVLNGYNTLPDQMITVYSDQTTTTSARYILSPNLKVLISPQAAINAGAKWRVDSSPWQSSGASLTDLAPGPHSITFNTVANWTPPCRQIVYLTEGQPSTTTGIYTVPSTIRALRVTIEPQAAAAAGARWRVDSSPWQTSGTTLTGLSVGQHTVKFNIIPGWVTPLNKTVAISSGITACTTGVYAAIQPPGALNVTALPQAVIGKAYWRVFDGAFETPWRAAGAGPINVPAGEHTVFFSDLAGFVTPASQTVTVIAGQTLNLTGTYIIAPTTTGTLTVSLARPMAMGAQARWRVYDGPSGYSSNWLNMGARLLKVPTGQHTVVFKPVPGWVTPNDQTVTITVGQDTKATATYTR